MAEILGKLTKDLDVWRMIGRTYKIDLFCGWFMQGGDEGVSISPGTMAALAERGIELDICLYGTAAGPMTSIRRAAEADAEAWLAMRMALWPDANEGELRLEVGRYFVAHGEPLLPHCVFVADDHGKIVGMLELSLRPYAGWLQLFAGAVHRRVVRGPRHASQRRRRRAREGGGAMGA